MKFYWHHNIDNWSKVLERSNIKVYFYGIACGRFAIGLQWPEEIKPWVELENKFCGLLRDWCQEHFVMSSTTAICNCPSYLEIIKMGKDVIPLILHDLKYRPEPLFWFEALRQLTGADPVLDEHHGQLRKMAQDWLQWAKDNHASIA